MRFRPTRAILSADSLKIKRTPIELLKYCDATVDKLKETVAGKEYLRSGKRLPKKLLEEVYPLAQLGKCFLQEGYPIAACVPNLGNENYDGVLELNNSNNIDRWYIEITNLKNGYDERLRLQKLNNKVSVSARGNIKRSGTKASGKQKIDISSETGPSAHNLCVSSLLKIAP